MANEPDSVYIFAYGTNKNSFRNGLHFAWSIDRAAWHPIGPETSFVRSDYGSFGSGKRMIAPFVFCGKDKMWHCVWEVNAKDSIFGHTSSPDLVYWGRQSYPRITPNSNRLSPDVYYDVTTSPRQEATISGVVERGTIHKVAWSVVENLLNADRLKRYEAHLNAERVELAPELFKDSIRAKLIIDANKSKKISDLLIGVFFEDINYAADGGLYAEKVQNRGFEYSPDENRRDPNWDHTKAWSADETKIIFRIDTLSPVHTNNKHYATLQITEQGAGLVNEGFGGIPIKAGDKYDFSLFVRSPETRRGKLTVRLIGKNGEVYGEAHTKTISKDWKKHEVVITARKTINDAHLEVIPQMTGRVDVDLISLFPQKTFKNRKNGLRADLAQVIADLKPRFVRFPGGCVAHGNGLNNIYRWEETIGPLEARKSQWNLWGYHQSMGLGYYEYFQFCEDIGAEPVPVVAAGVCCQNSSVGSNGQQGIPLCNMHDYVQDVLNLIEWANGDPKKSEWAKKRAQAGHPKPFNLKYVGIGNEDLITDVFEERFTMLFNAVKEKYPEITVIGTTGPFSEGTDYVEGWNLATKLRVPMADEHYYQPAGWFLNNQDYYDKYDRNKAKVYLGEYATHIPGKRCNIETALLEALHLIGCERNGDIVSMTSYAPLLAKEGYTRWNPDLIYFNNTEVKPTVSYFTQKLFGENSGEEYIHSTLELSDKQDIVRKRVAVSVVKGSNMGDLILKIVNILPVPISFEIDPVNLGAIKQTAVKTVLHGQPDDRNARPQTSQIEIDGIVATSLEPYSLTVIRLKTQ